MQVSIRKNTSSHRNMLLQTCLVMAIAQERTDEFDETIALTAQTNSGSCISQFLTGSCFCSPLTRAIDWDCLQYVYSDTSRAVPISRFDGSVGSACSCGNGEVGSDFRGSILPTRWLSKDQSR